jgi:peptidoglycan hydrolase-like protein with peptidoglycan-binding domain
VYAGVSGTLTWLPDEGTTVKRNMRLYEVDGHPVRLMHGNRPMYRPLRQGDKGPDVQQLETNLRDLGLGSGLTVDKTYDAATVRAVKRWQHSVGLPQTGKVDPGQIMFAPGTIVIVKRSASVGERAAPDKPLMEVASTDVVIKVLLPIADQRLARTNDKVIVGLPDGSKAPGRITLVGSPTGGGQRGDGGDSGDDAKVPVEVRLDDPQDAAKAGQSPVSVEFATTTRKDVLSVPVEALLALPEGGFGVQLLDGSTPTVVKIQIGLFAGGQVEITGGNLAEGMKVGVPAT